MALTFWLLAGVAISLGAMAWLAVGVGSRMSYRVGAVCTLIVGLGVGFVAITELMGRPKPIEQAWLERDQPAARVLAMRLEKDRAIYLWLLLPGETAPRSYALPWMRRTAEKLDDAMTRAGERDHRLQIEGPMSKWSLYSDGELPLSIIAPPRPPQKAPPNQAREVKPGGSI